MHRIAPPLMYSIAPHNRNYSSAMLTTLRLRNPGFSDLQGKSLPPLCVPYRCFLYSLHFLALGYESDGESEFLTRNEVHLALLGSRCYARETAPLVCSTSFRWLFP